MAEIAQMSLRATEHGFMCKVQRQRNEAIEIDETNEDRQIYGAERTYYVFTFVI